MGKLDSMMTSVMIIESDMARQQERMENGGADDEGGPVLPGDPYFEAEFRARRLHEELEQEERQEAAQYAGYERSDEEGSELDYQEEYGQDQEEYDHEGEVVYEQEEQELEFEQEPFVFQVRHDWFLPRFDDNEDGLAQDPEGSEEEEEEEDSEEEEEAPERPRSPDARNLLEPLRPSQVELIRDYLQAHLERIERIELQDRMESRQRSEQQELQEIREIQRIPHPIGFNRPRPLSPDSRRLRDLRQQCAQLKPYLNRNLRWVKDEILRDIGPLSKLQELACVELSQLEKQKALYHNTDWQRRIRYFEGRIRELEVEIVGRDLELRRRGLQLIRRRVFLFRNYSRMMHRNIRHLLSRTLSAFYGLENYQHRAPMVDAGLVYAERIYHYYRNRHAARSQWRERLWDAVQVKMLLRMTERDGERERDAWKEARGVERIQMPEKETEGIDDLDCLEN